MASAFWTTVFAWLCFQLVAVILRYGCNVKQLSIGWLSVSLQTQALNRRVYNLGRRYANELRQWFGLGVLVAGMLGISSAFILLRELWQAIKWADQASMVGGGGGSGLSLGLAVPGLTVPWSHAVYLWLATAISFAAHEAGHALAAAAEGVGLHYVAAFTIVVLPGALVALDTETMAILSPARTLKIVCGGVWHNAVFCGLCWLVALLLPFLLMPAYSTGGGAVVRSVLEESPLVDFLSPADRITRVNQCGTRNVVDWLGCMAHLQGPWGGSQGSNYSSAGIGASLTASELMAVMAQPIAKQGGGYCIKQELQAHSAPCTSSQECKAGELCFQEVRHRWRQLSEDSYGASVLEPQKQRGNSSIEQPHASYGAKRKARQRSNSQEAKRRKQLQEVAKGLLQGSCISARSAASSQPCGGPGGLAEGGGGRCPAMSSCYIPMLESTEELLKVCYKKGYNRLRVPRSAQPRDPRTRSFEERAIGQNEADGFFGRSIREAALGKTEGEWQTRRQRDPGCPEFVVFVGSRGSLLQAIEVTDYAPAAWWVPMGLPHMLEQLLAYTFSVSAALALLNMAPVYGLDGEAALRSLFELGDARDAYFRYTHLRGARGLRAGRWVRLTILSLGTGVFALLLSLHVLHMTGLDARPMRWLATLRHLLTFSVRWG